MRQLLCPLLIGRDDEVAAIRGALTRFESGDGGVMLLLGEAGVGKSRLAREAASLARDRHALVLSGRAIEGEPFRPFAEAFLATLRATGLPKASELEAFRPALGRLVPEWKTDVSGDASPDESLLILSEAVVRLLRVIGGDGGCLLILEDLHWADAESLAIVEYLADNLPAERILCLATARIDESVAATEIVARLVSRRAAEVVTVRRLDDAEVAAMAQACLGGAPIPPTLEDLLHAWAEGLPFLVEEVLAACAESGVLAPTPGGWTVSGEHKLPIVPRTFAGMVQRRQSALDDRTRLVLAAAALLGQHFDWSLLPAVCDLSAGEVLVSLRAAVDVQLVAVDDDDTGGAFRFRHALSREAVLDQLLPPERAALARRAADTIEAAQPELVGDWCELSANLHALGGRRSRAAGLFLEVGRRSLARGALVSAEQAFVRAGSLAGDTVLAAHADESLLAVLTLAGKAERALAVGGELLGRLDHLGAGAERRLAVHLRLAQAAIAATRWDTAREHLDVARALATSTDHGEALPRADVLSAQVAVGQARLEAAEVLARRALDGAELSGQPDVACEALEVIGRLARLHDLTEAERAFERARAMALENGLTVWHLRALHELGTIDSLESGALDRLIETREAALSIGALATAAVADLHLAATLSTHFDPDGALEAASRCAEISRRFRLGTLAASLVFQAASWAQRGDRQRAEAVLAEALEAAGDEPDIPGRAWGWVRAISSLLDEDHERATSELDRGIEFMRPGGIGPHPFTGLWVLLHTVKGGRGDEARSEVHAAGSKVALYNRAYLGYADAVALGRRGAPDDAMRAFVVAETELGHRRGSDWLRHLAHRLVAEAAIVHDWGDPAGWLRESLAFFDGRGETRIAAACRSLLRRAGSPVPRRRGSDDVPLGLRALGVTSREMDVLRLVAGGLSNAGIAEHLCISSRTVETHVASLMRKIGAARRQDLRQVAISVSQPTKSGSDPDAGEATDSARLWT